ncbi:RHS repeat-associated core domain-containing protein [Pseudomonas sp. NFACC08-1]|uniref:RHS repeat-associated core domain-containing protein n=1 Tax=Pseudomonas sp. NFACC08-1 TaxID=1566238 RepID=UPI000894D0D9|nr:RHS repeat-associated core domain-containing protein [Pseudomonas sp. NFACC08-1]SDW21539.1 RHS repeat-associated core domain-containing protein [Pseudomonas sp. NFACC08-1]
MSTVEKQLLCRYHYDPLDKLVGQQVPGQPDLQRFYCRHRLATEIQGALRYSLVQQADLLLAQQSQPGETRLLATDQQRSILHTLDSAGERNPVAYSAYGHRPAQNGLLSLLGFNGERPDPITGHYLLGNGYRAFNPVLMRFNSPDSWSPFRPGILNSYAYCLGDPINRRDNNGHLPVKWIMRIPFRKIKLHFLSKKINRATTDTIHTFHTYKISADEQLQKLINEGIPGAFESAHRGISLQDLAANKFFLTHRAYGDQLEKTSVPIPEKIIALIEATRHKYSNYKGSDNWVKGKVYRLQSHLVKDQPRQPAKTWSLQLQDLLDSPETTSSMINDVSAQDIEWIAQNLSTPDRDPYDEAVKRFNHLHELRNKVRSPRQRG